MEASCLLRNWNKSAESEREKQSGFKHRVNVCVAAGCQSCQSEAVKTALEKELAGKQISGGCQVKGVGCMGLCSEGPLVSTNRGVLYQKVTESDAGLILDSLDANPVERLICRTDVPFFERQKKIVLENSGNIDPERIEDYIAAAGIQRSCKS